ncbi:putative procollagen-lysine,2-oxoglutarate 5-dioxygenase 3 [Sesbania bispinosa]|nr:putative procollagen-lysine,2-oxoglutarate 5-dioxygenase 3 [Sesbania bispinosa]
MNETESDRQILGQTPAKDKRDNESQSPIATQTVPNVASSSDKEAELEHKVTRIGTSVEQLASVVNGLTAFFNNTTVLQPFPNSFGFLIFTNPLQTPITTSSVRKNESDTLLPSKTPTTRMSPLSGIKSMSTNPSQIQKSSEKGKEK